MSEHKRREEIAQAELCTAMSGLEGAVMLVEVLRKEIEKQVHTRCLLPGSCL